MINTGNIQNIIFDLGGVILPIDISKTTGAFSKLGLPHIDKLFRIGHAESFFKEYERGAINDKEFVKAISNQLGAEVSEEEIINAWNALLLDFPPERIELIKNLDTRYRLFLFSNTNGIHHTAFHQQYRDITGGKNFDDLFEKSWYSHLIKYRKPDPQAYKYVITDGGIDPAVTVFIDDSLNNVEAAVASGLKGIHLAGGKTILDLF